MSRAEQRANDAQRESVRAELHAQVDALVDAWPALTTQSREMGRGFPSGGEGASSDAGTIVERVALSESFDPATAASEWLTDFNNARFRLKNLYGRLPRVLPVDPESIERGRVNTVDICAWCNDPAPKVKRLDGQPHCHPDLGKTCWRSAYDLKRRSA